MNLSAFVMTATALLLRLFANDVTKHENLRHMKRIQFILTSESPLLLHNGQTCDPMNSFSKMLKQISSKRDKTDADFEEMARIEWYASLYLSNGKICLPDEVIEAALIGGAKKFKAGKQAQAGLFATHHAILEFDGSDLDIDELWKRDTNRYTRGARIGTSKVMRTRFRVDEWKAKIEVAYDPGLFNEDKVIEILGVTGAIVGIGDWRPKFGRFRSEVLS